MNFFTVLLLIVIAGLAYDLIRQRNRARDYQEGATSAFDEAREHELQREVEALRERVKVLERIATDGNDSARLSDEIERLRDN